MTTIAKLSLWILTFAAAYFIKSTELISLTAAFFGLHAAIVGMLLVTLLLICAFGREIALQKYGRILIRVLRFSVAILITSIFSFLATMLVEVDFYIAYMLTTFGQCMYNIDYIDESDFTNLKAKLKAKKICKKPKQVPATAHVMPKKPASAPQTIADKKAPQPALEKNHIVDTTTHQDDKNAPEDKAEKNDTSPAVPVPTDTVQPAQSVPPTPTEKKKPVIVDLPID